MKKKATSQILAGLENKTKVKNIVQYDPRLHTQKLVDNDITYQISIYDRGPTWVFYIVGGGGRDIFVCVIKNFKFKIIQFSIFLRHLNYIPMLFTYFESLEQRVKLSLIIGKLVLYGY